MKREKRRTRYQTEKEKVTKDQPSEALNQSDNRALQNDDTFPTTSSTATGTQDSEKTALDNSLQTAIREDQPIYVTADMPGCSHWITVDRIPTETNQDKLTLRKKKKADWCRKKYHASKVYREKQKMKANLWMHQHYTNQEIKAHIKALNQARYRMSSAYKRKLLERSKSLYRKNKRHQNKKKVNKEQSITKYADNEEHRDRVKEQSITKYATEEAFRARVIEYSCTKYRKNKAHKEKIKYQAALRYRTNAYYRARKNLLLAKRIKQRYQVSDVFRNRLNTLKRKRYETQSDEQKQAEKRRRVEVRQSRDDMKKVIKDFREACKKGPDYTCSVCNRLLFEKQVKECDPHKYTKNEELSNRCINEELLHICNESCEDECEKKKWPTGKLWICFTCDSHLSRGKMPPQALANNLSPEAVPEELEGINTLEEQLLALTIPFAKIVKLPVGAQPGLKGPIVCVPSNVSVTTKVLPRPVSDADIINVKLKRKIAFKGHVNSKKVRTWKVKNALGYLRQHNPLYKDVQVDSNWDTIREDEALNQLLENGNRESSETDTEERINEENNNNDDTTNEQINEEDHLNGVASDTCLQAIDMATEALAEFQDGVFSVAPAQGNTPINLFRDYKLNTEATSFPGLFPLGKNTFPQPRETKLTLSKYFNSRLLSADLRFAQNAQYIFFAQHAKELDQLLSGISIAMRKGATKTKEGRRITADMLQDRDQLAEIVKSDTGYRHFESLRGSPAYWKRTMNDLFAMIRQLGLPTFFVTFSSGELSTRWPEVVKLIERQKGNDCHKPNYDQRCEILRSNPVFAVKHFDYRVKEFFKQVIRSPEQPLGNVTDSFIRLEFQQRGAPHIHCLLWVENAPVFDQDDDETVTAFVDRYISCKLPDESADPELHEMVTNVQMHNKNHSPSCKKGKKTCRFNFPKCVAKETFISRPDGRSVTEDQETDEGTKTISREKAKQCLADLAQSLTAPPERDISIDDIISQAGFQHYEEFQDALTLIGTKPEIVMQREVKDTWVNPYNPDLLRAWNANLDVQYILDPYSCVMYILSYISKSEHELGEILKTALEEIKEQNCPSDLRTQMKKLGTVYFENREVSVQESIVRTCGIDMKDSTRNVTFVPTDNNARLSKPLAQIQAIAAQNTEENIWMTSLEDRYRARPTTQEFEAMCQATFASEYRVLPKAEGNKNKRKPIVFKLQNNLGYIQKRTRGPNAVIRFTKFSETNNPEKYYESQLKLYLPFRLDSHLKPDQYESYEDFHNNAAVKVSGELKPVKVIVGENRMKYEKSSAALEQAWQQLLQEGPLEDAWSTVSPESDLARREALEDRDPTENDDRLDGDVIPELQEQREQAQTLVSVEWLGDKMKPLLQSMNQKQKEIFYFVREWCLQKVQNKRPAPFYLHVTGGAGTGKSHLIKCIYHEASKILGNPENPEEVKVLLTGPTGTSAFNIGGFTVHSALKIPRNARKNYESLGNDSLNTLQTQLAGLEILIIDEISMVDRKVLAYVHGRMKQIKQIRTTDRDSYFGGVCILAVGDFYQLPPVKGKPLCVPDFSYGYDMWNEVFKIVKLEEIMRQKEDHEFANLLNKLRTKAKAQSLSSEDEAVLLGRSDRHDIPDDALHVFPKNVNVAHHNGTMLAKHCPDIKVIGATDQTKDKCSGNMKKLTRPKEGASDDLADSLTIGKGARVMLIRNIDVGDGLVNGAFGTVEGFLEHNETVITVHVKFDSEKAGKKRKMQNNAVPIERTEENMSGQKGVVRRQFPLKLAWACTVHKVQGMTVNEIVYDMEGTFASGQAYVALSRATSLKGLYLKNFDAKLVYRHENVHKSLQLMTPFESNQPDRNCSYEIVHHNVHGLRSKLRDIKSNSDLSSASVLAFTETWLQSNVESEHIALEDYTICRKDRSDGRGGVALYVSSSLRWEDLLISTSLECCAIKINPENNAAYIVVAIYRPPKHPVHQFGPLLQDVLRHSETTRYTEHLCYW